MATYYCHFGLTTGNNNGTSPADAWQTFEDALAGTNGTMPNAGDTVLCHGEQLLTGQITMSTYLLNSGTALGSMISFIGVNSSWENDGVADNARLNANRGAFGILGIGCNYIWMENFKLYNTNKATLSTNDGASAIMGGSGGSNLWFYNCIFSDCYRGETNYFGSLGARYYIKCLFANNANYGTYGRNATAFIFCAAKNNGAQGFFTSNTSPTYYGCIAANNGSHGFVASAGWMYHCVAHGNAGDGINAGGTLIGCRATENNRNFGTGTGQVHIACADIDTIAMSLADSMKLWCEIRDSFTDSGYVDAANGDFNLTSDAIMRRVPIALPS
jgi:hypothetical protein